MARDHLAKGQDVVVAQAYGVEKFLEEWESLAEESGATYHEFVLYLDKESVSRRYSARAKEAEHEFVAHHDEISNVESLTEKVDRVAKARKAKIVSQTEGEPEAAYQELLRQLH